MKNVVITTAVLFFVTCLFNSNAYSQSIISAAETEKNQHADNEFLRALQTGDVSRLDSTIISPDFINHGVGEKVGIDSLRSSIQMFHSRLKPKVEVPTRVMNGEYFGDWVRFTCADSTMVIEGIEMTRYSNGKAVENWFFPGGQRRR